MRSLSIRGGKFRAIVIGTSVTLFAILLLLCILLGVTYLKKDYIAQRILKKLADNNGLHIEMQHTSLSLFPLSLSQNIVLEKVVILAADPENPILTARKLLFRFNIFELLLKPEFTLKKIEAQHGKVLVNNDLVDLFKKNTRPSSIKLNLSDIDLEDIKFEIKYGQVSVTLFGKKNRLTFTNDSIPKIRLQGASQISSLTIDKLWRLPKPIGITYDIYFVDKRLIAEKFMISVEKVILNCSKSAIDFRSQEFLVYLLKPSMNVQELKKLENLYLQNITRQIPLIPTTGDLQFHFMGYGLLNNPSKLRCKCRLKGKDFAFSDTTEMQQLSDVNFDLGYSGTLSQGILKINSANFTWRDIPVNINGKIAYTKKTHLDIRVSYATKKNQLLKFENIELVNLSGSMKVKGSLSNVTQENLLQISRSGDITIESIFLKDPNFTLRNISAFFDGGTIKGESFMESNFATGYLYSEIENFRIIPTRNQSYNLVVNSRLNCDMLNVDLLSATIQKFQTKARNSQEHTLPPLYLTLYLSCKKFIIRGNEGSNLTGKLLQYPNFVRISDAKANFFEGHFTSDLQLNREPSGYVLTGAAELKHIDVSKAFAFFDNFNQKNLTYQEISGNLSGNFSFKSKLNSEHNIIPETFWCTADIEITDGVLRSSLIQKALSSYIDPNVLSEIQFATLKNRILVNEQRITIPEMRVENNVFSINFSGTQQFSGQFEYAALFNFSDIIKRNKKKDLPTNSKNNTPTLGVIIQGNSLNYTVKLQQHVFKLPDMTYVNTVVKSIDQKLNEPVPVPETNLEYQNQDDEISFDSISSTQKTLDKKSPIRGQNQKSNLDFDWKDD